MASEKQRPSFTNCDFIQQVNIKVGPEAAPVSVFEDFICYHSKVFRNAFKGPWKEGEEKAVSVADTNLAVFGAFVAWLYTGEIPQAFGIDWEADEDILDSDDLSNDGYDPDEADEEV
ncbi:hypothetical protein LTS18_005290 [Coniosporium uncinatum]|uniref:Uncharacterized protein n=1 Tax=Coniosporium uncinatum TaxID=93489 RepID=A0ACC3D4R6_9PEZI|nr:hypothetical protein LTS18_005290 [Coniosporium uncinatum]